MRVSIVFSMAVLAALILSGACAGGEGRPETAGTLPAAEAQTGRAVSETPPEMKDPAQAAAETGPAAAETGEATPEAGEAAAEAGEAAPDTGLAVAEMEFCADVRDRAPVGAAGSFPADIARVYCFTRIVGARDTTSVAHVWYFEGREMSRVELPVRSASWRTWSVKRMAPEYKGAWKVEVIAGDAAVLASKEFVLN